MATPLLLQALELNALIWKWGPFIRFPFQWNSAKCRFDTETSFKRNLPWFCCSVIPFGISFFVVVFIITFALREPHIDKMQNWISSFEELPLAAYIFFYSVKVMITSPTIFCSYHNQLIGMSLGDNLTKKKAGSIKRKGILGYICPLIKGTSHTRNLKIYRAV